MGVRGVLAAAVTLSLLAGGCAGDGDELSRRQPTSTTAPAATGTTAPAPPTSAPPTTVPVPAQVVLAPDGLGIVAFGDDGETVLAALAGVLGPPVDDRPLGSCPSGEADRLVQFAELAVLLGGGRFVAWDVGPASGTLPSLATAEGIGVGSSVAELRAAYGERLRLDPDDPFGPVFEVTTPSPGRLGGTLTGTGPADPVATLSGGTASCG
ncbi:MAG TPA: hypothetical protein VGR26_14185 [Acidimicrobiales bacterium]|nr:hypothetical protein [Acidimicrobiales bacterium]